MNNLIIAKLCTTLDESSDEEICDNEIFAVENEQQDENFIKGKDS